MASHTEKDGMDHAESSAASTEKGSSGLASLFSCWGPRKPQSGGGSAHSKAAGGGDSGAKAWEPFLPQPTDDLALRERFNGVFTAIEKHVEDFYRDKTFLELDAGHEACLSLVSTPCLPAPVFELVQSNRPTSLICRPTTLIKHCLSYLILQAMIPDGDAGRNCLLPPYMASLPQALKGLSERPDKTAFNEAYAHWRVLTAYLQPPAENDNASRMARSAAIRSIIDRVSGAFAPWEFAPGSPEQRASITSILDKASETGQLLFAQPASFSFVWEPQNLTEEEDPRRIVVLHPGVIKTSIEKGGREKKDVIMPPMHIPLTFPAGVQAAA